MPASSQRPKRSILIFRVGSKEIRLVDTNTSSKVVSIVVSIRSISIESHKAVIELTYIIILERVPFGEIARERLSTLQVEKHKRVNWFISQRLVVVAHIVHACCPFKFLSAFCTSDSSNIVFTYLFSKVKLRSKGVRRIIASFFNQHTTSGYIQFQFLVSHVVLSSIVDEMTHFIRILCCHRPIAIVTLLRLIPHIKVKPRCKNHIKAQLHAVIAAIIFEELFLSIRYRTIMFVVQAYSHQSLHFVFRFAMFNMQWSSISILQHIIRRHTQVRPFERACASISLTTCEVCSQREVGFEPLKKLHLVSQGEAIVRRAYILSRWSHSSIIKRKGIRVELVSASNANIVLMFHSGASIKAV